MEAFHCRRIRCNAKNIYIITNCGLLLDYRCYKPASVGKTKSKAGRQGGHPLLVLETQCLWTRHFGLYHCLWRTAIHFCARSSITIKVSHRMMFCNLLSRSLSLYSDTQPKLATPSRDSSHKTESPHELS